MFKAAQEIYDALKHAGLLDSQGQVIGADRTADRTQGIARGFSSFEEDEIDLYSIDIAVFSTTPREAIWANARDRHAADPESLLCLAGHAWTLTLRQLQPDAEIPTNITSSILDALGEGHVLGERDFPEPRWFETQYETADAISRLLKSAGFPVGVMPAMEIKKWDTADAYIEDSIETDEFAFAVLIHTTRAGTDALLRLHLFIEEHCATHNPSWFDAYFPIEIPHSFVSGDGWIVRVVQDEFGSATPDDLLDGAQSIHEILGGVVVTHDGELSTLPSPKDDADDNLFGFQGSELVELFGRLDTVSPAEASMFDAEPFVSENHARDRARRRASVVASESGRETPWHQIMNLTGPNAPMPAWFANERTVSAPNPTVLRAAFNLLFAAQCTADALLLRDLVGLSGGVSQADYDLLTRPWPSVIGQIHPEDPYLPQAWGARRTPGM